MTNVRSVIGYWAGEQLGIDRVLIDRGSAVLDELEPQRRIAAHQPLDDVARRLTFLIRPGQRDLDQAAGIRTHGGLAKLHRVHLAEALEAADLDLLPLEFLGLDL